MEHPSTQLRHLLASDAKEIRCSSRDAVLNDLLDKLVCMLAERVARGYAGDDSNDGGLS